MIIALWTAQIILAAFFVLGTVMKFLPIKKISVMMPWTGQLPSIAVRLLGILDLVVAAGLILPVLLNIKPYLTIWTAIATLVYMVIAAIFHISRGELKQIGVNIFAALLAAFIAYGLY
jgi:hypothetical protein